MQTMHMDAVIGCDAVDAAGDWLRFTTARGATRTIPWSAVQVAGFGSKSDHISVEGVTEQVAPYQETHDAVWIIYPDGVAQLMIESDGSRRGELLGRFVEKLGARWKGAQFSSGEIMTALFTDSARSASRGIPKMMILMFGVIFFSLVVLMIAVFLAHRN
jgi:hypothetical protein